MKVTTKRPIRIVGPILRSIYPTMCTEVLLHFMCLFIYLVFISIYYYSNSSFWLSNFCGHIIHNILFGMQFNFPPTAKVCNSFDLPFIYAAWQIQFYFQMHNFAETLGLTELQSQYSTILMQFLKRSTVKLTASFSQLLFSAGMRKP